MCSIKSFIQRSVLLRFLMVRCSFTRPDTLGESHCSRSASRSTSAYGRTALCNPSRPQAVRKSKREQRPCQVLG
jgi:hypothetical protein